MNSFEFGLESFIHEVFGSRCRSTLSNWVTFSGICSDIYFDFEKVEVQHVEQIEFKLKRHSDRAWEPDQSAGLMLYLLWQMGLTPLTQPGLFGSIQNC